MPRLTKSLPKYRHHKATGQAVVTIQGRDFYLGPHGTKASKVEYDRLVSEWLAQGRPVRQMGCSVSITITELCAAFWKHAKSYYSKNGKPTGTAEGFKPVIRLLRQSYGCKHACEFGPLSLKSLRHKMIDLGHSRRYINDNVERIKRIFNWGVSEELVESTVHQALQSVSRLRKGRSEARETAPVQLVEDDIVDQTLPHMSQIVADMVRFQRLTGCRPGEVCLVRPCDVDMSGDVWTYRPESHKTEHHGKERVVFIGPRAQDILRPYLLRESLAYCFSPAESEQQRLRTKHAQRKTPPSQGNRPGTNKKRNSKRRPGTCYNNDSYRRAIHRACDVAFPPPDQLARRENESVAKWHARLTIGELDELNHWQSAHRWSPNQIRHTAATKIRKEFGLEGAQVTLGHASADVTQIYAERDQAKAAEIMRQVG